MAFLPSPARCALLNPDWFFFASSAMSSPVAAIAIFLQPGRLPQRRIDPVLPTRPAFLKMVENIAIDTQRDDLLGAGKGRGLRQRLGGPGGRSLESRFGGLSRIARSSYHRATV